MKYWEECLAESFDEHGVSASLEQLAAIAKDVEGAHECYGMAFGHDCIPDPIAEENKRLSIELKRERSKVTCRTCSGYGSVTSSGGPPFAISQCWKCRGEGKHVP